MPESVFQQIDEQFDRVDVLLAMNWRIPKLERYRKPVVILQKTSFGRLQGRALEASSLAYLDSLRQPFYKVQGEHFALKGLQGQCSLRVGVHNGFLNELQRVESCIEGSLQAED